MRQDEEKAGEIYNKWMKARGPYGWFGRYVFKFTGELHAKTLIEQLSITKDDKILDVGCGTAVMLIELAKLLESKNPLHGIETSDEMLKITGRNIKAAGLESRIILQKGQATTLPFANGSFDVAICMGVAKYMTDDTLAESLSEMNRVLGQGGRIILTEFGTPSRRTIKWAMKRHGVEKFRSRDELESKLNKAGFADINMLCLEYRECLLRIKQLALAAQKSFLNHES